MYNVYVCISMLAGLYRVSCLNGLQRSFAAVGFLWFSVFPDEGK